MNNCEIDNLKAEIELLRDDLLEAYEVIIYIMDMECCCYNRDEIYDKASAYIEEYRRDRE